MSWEQFEHTADLGLRVVSDDLEGLFREAAEALVAAIVEVAPGGQPTERRRLRLSAARLDDLLFDWLSEILYAVDGRGLIPLQLDVRIEGSALEARMAFRAIDPGRDRLLREVKAITYHGLRVEPTKDGWLAELIVDI